MQKFINNQSECHFRFCCISHFSIAQYQNITRQQRTCDSWAENIHLCLPRYPIKQHFYQKIPKIAIFWMDTMREIEQSLQIHMTSWNILFFLKKIKKGWKYTHECYSDCIELKYRPVCPERGDVTLMKRLFSMRWMEISPSKVPVNTVRDKGS